MSEHVDYATVPDRAAGTPRGDKDGAFAAGGSPGDIRGTVKSASLVSGIRVITVIAVGFGGIVLFAVSLGAVAGRLASSGRVLLAATVATTATAFASGMIAEPILRRRAARLRQVGQGDLEPQVPAASAAPLERPSS